MNFLMHKTKPGEIQGFPDFMGANCSQASHIISRAISSSEILDPRH